MNENHENDKIEEAFSSDNLHGLNEPRKSELTDMMRTAEFTLLKAVDGVAPTEKLVFPTTQYELSDLQEQLLASQTRITEKKAHERGGEAQAQDVMAIPAHAEDKTEFAPEKTTQQPKEAPPTVYRRKQRKNGGLKAVFRADKTPTMASVEKTPQKGSWIYRTLAVLVMILTLFLPLCFFWAYGTFYYIYEGDELISAAFLQKSSDEQALENAGIAVGEADAVVSEKFGDSRILRITRAMKLKVKADGQECEIFVNGGTVADALAKTGIVLGEFDAVSHTKDEVLKAGMDIVVTRIRYETRAVTEAVAWREVQKPTPLLADGVTKVMNEGEQRDGEAKRVYKDTYTDGILTSSTIESETVTKMPWDHVTLVGDRTAAATHLDGAQFTDIKIIDNAPESYKSVITDGTCTAYSFKPGVWGAAGLYMIQGFVAVDPDVIPYGSLLYITSADGGFVYGWAVAADVGAAMVDGRVDIDCFFETYDESCLFGKHTMNIYIVEQLPRELLEPYVANRGMFDARVG
ncbi:MAG: 3D domain-containing protein [Oscillospiraceae bacterium]